MYLGVDVGGTKTLVATLDDHGVILEEIKFPTPKDFQDFSLELEKTIRHLQHQEFKAATMAAPGRIDYERGTAVAFGNLPWKDVPIRSTLEKIVNAPVCIENDANLAGLSESMVHREYDNLLYITVSTGIGTGSIYKQSIVPYLQHSEGGHMLLPFDGKLTEWEDFASGRAIVDYFGKPCAEIHDEKSWRIIAHNLCLGFYQHIALLQPDIIVIGGSVGTYFDQYGDFLIKELEELMIPMLRLPVIAQAKRPEKAVVYGCYDLAKATHG
jgi:predicted NBD/HSP70 family sugar kinase